MKKKGKVILGILVGAGAVAAAAFGISKIGGIMNNSPQNPSGSSNDPVVVLKLEAPTNLNYDKNNYMLSWNEVNHADGYTVNVNGTNYTVDKNEYYYVPYTDVTTFKVQATDSTGAYKTSEWSTNYSYTMEAAEETGINLPAVNKYVADAFGGYKFEKVISLYNKGSNVFCMAIFDGQVRNFVYFYDHEVESLDQVIKNNDYESVADISAYEVKNFDTASYYLQNNNIIGKLKEYKDQGYSIEVVTSQAYEISNSRIGLAGVYKVSLGDDVKYFAVENNFLISATAVEGKRYTDLVKDLATTYMREESCGEITGDFITALDCYAGENNTTVSKAYAPSYSYNYDDGWSV